MQQKQGCDDVEQFCSSGREAQQGLAKQQSRQAARAHGSAHHVGGRNAEQAGNDKGYPQKGHTSLFVA